MDLRERIVTTCDSGEWTRQEVAEQFGVSVSWIRRLLQRRREDGTYAPKQGRRGRKPVFFGKALKRLDVLVQQQPDATLEELRTRMGFNCSLVTVFNTLKRLGYRRKKRLSGLLSKIGRTSNKNVELG